MRHEDNCLKEKSKFPNFFMIWCGITFNGPEKIAIIILTVNADVYIEVFDNFQGGTSWCYG